MRVAYVNGEYVPYHQAVVPMEDRGYQFADGIYEVAMFFNHRFLDLELHLERLHRSLNEMRITEPMSDGALKLILSRLVSLNPYKDGYIYVQITRGVARRNHLFPKNVKPSLTISVMPARPMKAEYYEKGAKVITHPDNRWSRCDIKSTALLANVLARQTAFEAGAVEVFMYNKEGCLTEGSLSTAFIVKDGVVMTHPENEAVLPGVRKHVIRELCRLSQIPYQERMIPMSEVAAADEAFMTSANSHVLPITQIDDTNVGDGKPGKVTLRLLELYRAHVTEQTGKLWN